MDARDLLLADLEYIRGCFWKNEDIGEKRFGFFVTVVTAVAAGLVALSADPSPEFPEILKWALVALFVFGVLTSLRMIHRNTTADEYKRMSNEIWEVALELSPGLKAKSYKLNWPSKKGLSKWARAGYAEFIGVINGALLGALLGFALDVPFVIALLGSVVVAILFWVPSLMRK